MHVPPEHRMPQWTDSQTGPLEKRNEERASAVKFKAENEKLSLSGTSGERKDKESENRSDTESKGTEPKLREGGRGAARGRPK